MKLYFCICVLWAQLDHSFSAIGAKPYSHWDIHTLVYFHNFSSPLLRSGFLIPHPLMFPLSFILCQSLNCPRYAFAPDS